MANVEITWALGADALTNIDSIVVHKKQNGTCAQLQAEALAGSPAPIFTDMSRVSTSYTDTNVGQGTWRYGVFVKNSAGVNVCDAGPGDSSATVTIA
jgi:hypothetical protein